MKKFQVWVRAVGALLLSACAGGGGGGGGGMAAFEGTYNVTSYTENTTGCEVVGPSVASEHPAGLTAVVVNFFVDVLTLHPCEDATDCAAVMADVNANDTIPFFDGFIFETVTGNTATGRVSSASGFGDECNGRVVNFTLTLNADGSIRLESRTQESDPFPPAADGSCDTEDAEAAAAGTPCTELTVIEASPF